MLGCHAGDRFAFEALFWRAKARPAFFLVRMAGMLFDLDADWSGELAARATDLFIWNKLRAHFPEQRSEVR